MSFDCRFASLFLEIFFSVKLLIKINISINIFVLWKRKKQRIVSHNKSCLQLKKNVKCSISKTILGLTHWTLVQLKTYSFFFWVQIKVQKGVFFNTKYLPKHQGVSCCDLLHQQYLSDASFFHLFAVSSSASRAGAWRRWKWKITRNYHQLTCIWHRCLNWFMCWWQFFQTCLVFKLFVVI